MMSVLGKNEVLNRLHYVINALKEIQTDNNVHEVNADS